MQGSYANGFAPRDGQPLYPELWHGCIGAWAPCLGPTGSVLRDWSGRNYTAETIGTGNAFTPADGKWASTINGSGIYGTGTIAHGVGTGEFTIAMWVNPTTIASAYKGCFAVGLFAPAIYTTLPGSTWGMYWGANRSSGDTLLAGVFSHICVRRIAGVLQFFTNGIRSGTTHAVVLSMSAAGIGLGGERSGVATNAFAGSFDDARFYTHAISDNEIKLLASRRGIAYEPAPRRRSSVQVVGGFRPAWVPRQRLIIGGGV